MKKTGLFLFLIVCSCKVQTQLPDIAGVYDVVPYQNENLPCTMRIEITKDSKGYNYLLISSERDVKGKLEIFDQDKQQKRIELIGLPYDAYDEQYDDRPYAGGSLVNDTIIIQNYGNSMNDYMKLGECQDKYIALVKRK